MRLRLSPRLAWYISKILPLLAVFAIAFGVTSILIIISGFNPGDVFGGLFSGGFGSAYRFGQTLNQATPLLFCALGLLLVFKAGIWNIGAEGQLYIGAVGALIAGYFVPSIPGPLQIILMVIFAFVFGALWGAIPGYLRARFNTNEIIISLLLVFVAMWFVSYLVKFPWRSTTSAGFPVSETIWPTSWLPILPGVGAHAGIIIALVLAAVVWFILQRSTYGYHIKAVGVNPDTARYGGIPVRKVSSITELIKDTATFILRGSNVKCELSLPDDIWPVEIDEVQMTQVINNLAINAGEAMPEGGTIHIEAKNTVVEGDALPLPAGKYVEITVEDHGIGIEKEHLSRIFEPYFTTKLKGSGLGLATTYSIIKNHDGYITVESEVGVGTIFRIYLPASKRPVPIKKREEAVQSAFPGRGKILVMDDEEIIREMLSKMLPLAGYEVELVKDGAEAIERYVKAKKAGQPFDAVIMDLTVPGGMGGREAIKELLEIAPAAKVIVSSGYATDSIMADYKKYGFSAIATKPYSTGELERILHNILKK